MVTEGANEEDIFRHALQFESRDEQRSYVKRACGEDVASCAAVEALLQQHHASSILDAPALESLFPHEATPLTESPGTIIGRYKLLEKIGEGGMAVVYMAEQQEPIRRKVALKIIKLGMDTRQVIARFEAERQALAMMDHPSIAKVLDAGATETGRPYFVMELVAGVSITEYCDKNSLSTKDRLGLFLQVCHAVQHAHQKGIIHRDLKPSNVMVTHHDGKPVPKVIDFGIAKATNQKLTEKTLFTRYAHIIGTPAYMSPEQAELSDLDIDTRTDIYSLGVLLYELLTGTTPFSEEELRKAGYVEMQRVIREQEPAKPSTKLTTLGESLNEVAKLRGCTPDLLRKAVRGDLDWIVMKSLEKDRARRYEAAEGLAVDIQRHLEHRPVLAHAPSTTYRLQKLLHRHRSQAIAALAIAVVAGTVVVTLSVWNRYQTRLAEAEGTRQVSTLSEARRLIGTGDYPAARKTLRPILESEHVGLEARTLFAGLIVDGQEPDETVKGTEAVMKGHYRERVQYYTRKIKAEPDDAEGFLQRAQQYYYLHVEEKANADVRQYSGIVSHGTFFSFRFSAPTNLGPAINSSRQEFPIGLTLDGLSLWFERTSTSAAEPGVTLVATRARKDDPWGTPVSLGVGGDPRLLLKTIEVIPGHTTGDGIETYFLNYPNYAPAGGYGSYDLWMMKREAIGADWSSPVNLGPVVNSPDGELPPTISPDGLELYFGSSATPPRPGGYGSIDLWVTKRATRNDAWGTPTNLGPAVNSAYRENLPILLGDGLLLFFFSDRPGGYGNTDLYVTMRTSLSDSWGPPVNLGPFVNSAGSELYAYMSADGSTLFFDSDRPGGYGGHDIWQVRILGGWSDSDPNNDTGPRGKPTKSGGERR